MLKWEHFYQNFVEKILRLGRSQYEFKIKFSVKVLTAYSLLCYVGALYNRWCCLIVE